jgi:hypothetical protein
VIGWEPIANVDVVKLATPAALIVPTPRTVVPSRKVTGPVAPAWTVAEKVTAWLGFDGFAEDASVMVTAAFATVTWVGGDVIVPFVAMLIAVTVIGFVPIGNEGTVKVAWPLTIGAVPKSVGPSKNEIGPVTPEGIGSVIVTGVLGGGLLDETIGATRTGIGWVTVTIVADEVAGLLFTSPEVVAVMGSVPTGKFETVIVATPFTIGAVPIGAVPLENVTVPVTPGGTVSVMVSGVFTGVLGAETTGGGMIGVALLTIWVRGTEVAAPLLVSPP